MKLALDFLSRNKEVVLATCEDNLPHVRVFQIMKQEETTLYFATSPIKDVYRELQANEHVEILAMAGGVSVRCVGQVNFEVDGNVQRWIYENNPVLPRLYSSYDKLEYFALPIVTMDYYDLRPTPPIFRHFDLEAGTEGSGFVGERFSKK